MTTLLKNILKDSVGRIFALIFLGLLLFALLLVLFGYRYTNTLQQSNELEKLQMIALTAQINLNGDEIDYLLKQYPKKDEIQINQQDAIYKKISNYLLDVKMANDLSSDISILTQKGDSLYYVISSARSPSYLHNYQQAPKEIFRNWSIGGNCPKYKDEKGIWLNAFAPIRNARGLVTSIILVDLNFDVFMQRSKQRLYLFLAASLALLTLIGFILLVQIKKILDRESTLKNELLRNKNLLETRNKETVSSIYYAKQIQNSVLPKPKRLKLCFDQSFVINKPLNIVGGDFWFYERINNKTIVIMADCTGHGVPSAFMSLIGYNIIYDIVKNKKVTDAS